ncbi:MAG: pilus assembly protein PilP [Thermodesulfovibrionales bacterium]
MTLMIYRIALLTAMLGLLGLSGCKDKPKPPVPVAARPAAQAPAVQAQLPEEPKIEKEVYVYDQKGRRDPFMSLVVDIKEKPKMKKKANPIENFDVDEIKLIAIAWEKNNHYAMITLPDGKSYTIKKGMTLGLYGGRVDEILQQTVKITEKVKDYKGQMITKDTILKLRQEGE